MGVVKEKLEAEWELVKFMGQEENTELRYFNIKILVVTPLYILYFKEILITLSGLDYFREKMEDLEDKITEEQQRKKQAEEKLQAQNKLLIGIREGLDHITEKLFLGEATGVPQTRNSVELLAVCTDKMSKLMTRLSGINIFMKKLEMEEDQFTPVGLELPKVRSGESIVTRP